MFIEYKTEVKNIQLVRNRKIPLKINSINEVNLFFNYDNNKFFNELFIRCSFEKPIKNLLEAKALSKPIIDNLINLMVYKFGAIIKEPTVHSYKTEEKEILASGSITLYDLPEYELNSNDYSWLTTEMDSQSLSLKLEKSVPFYRYKKIISEEDALSRFLLLYALLYDIKGGQDSVDRYIKSKDPNVEMKPTTRTNKQGVPAQKDETVYTWWRNQAQHLQTTTDIEDMIGKCRDLVDSLQELVLDEIKNHI
ncbi:hypothetical protein MOF24_06900 [Bacillus inaquosorum]|uniref:hypothetical protein n=1 Tax=Bacillus inaquosorum TaxID=483913 RepID=UPI00227E5FB5|nr:hypothetical protein [Bacillus inaquosorum]MCY9271455.1 hypothetical protein [Bacillus inaquosorum]